MKPDLTSLYTELGLRPDCSLAELQLAYRRKIAELHPDGGQHAQLTPEAGIALRRLIALYTTAIRFHRRYGRLPGASPRTSGLREPALPVVARAYVEHLPVPTPPPQAPRARIALSVAVTLLAVLFGLLALASGEWLR